MHVTAQPKLLPVWVNTSTDALFVAPCGEFVGLHMAMPSLPPLKPNQCVPTVDSFWAALAGHFCNSIYYGILVPL